MMLVGPQGSLEAILSRQQQHSHLPIVIVCHPHPLYQGTMNNKVVYMLARAFSTLGLSTLRFNYRGVGASDGSYGEGEGETADLLAVIDWFQQQYPHSPLWLAGFSFGCYVVANASQQRSVAQLLMVAPAVDHLPFNQFHHFPCPACIIQGDADEVVNYHSTEKWQQQLDQPPTWKMFAGAGHFFHGRLTELRQVVEQYYQDFLIDYVNDA